MQWGRAMRRALICTAVTAGLVAGVGQPGRAVAAPRQAAAAGRVDVLGKLHARNVSAAGHDVPLREALERIVPADYSINLPNAGAWAETPVSWQGGRTFVEALREALAGLPEVSAKIDTNLQMVTVRSLALPFGAAAPLAARPQGAAPGTAPAMAAPAPALGATPRAEPPMLAAQTQLPGAPPSASPAARPDTAGLQKTGMPNAVATKAAIAPVSQTLATPAIAVASKAIAAPAPAQPPAAVPSSAISTQAGSYSVPAAEVSRTWRLEVSDRTVKTALSRWAKEAGWQLVWEVPVDFGIDADATITGTFDDALHAVVHALDKSDTPIQAILYRGNKVLRIVAHGAAS